MINHYFLSESTDKLLTCCYFWSACSRPKKEAHERVKWIKIGRGRFSSAARKRAKDGKLESPRGQRREGRQVEIQREGQVVPETAQQWGTWTERGGQHRQSVGLGNGKNPNLKKGQTGAITTWLNHSPGKAESKVLHLNSSGERNGAIR